MIDEASEQPASGSGISTCLSGLRIAAVSAMKWTPQKTITVRVRRRRLPGEPERVADVVRDVLHLRQLVVVGEDDRVALAGELTHLVVERPQIGCSDRAHSTSSETPSETAAWVSAPTEMKSTPVSA